VTILSRAELERLVGLIAAGGVIACPTETFVGLLADAANPAAVAEIIRLKGRDPKNPIGLLLPNLASLDSVVAEIPTRARELASRHWPGPLTLVLRARPGLAPALQHDGKVGVRVPGASPALEVVRAFGRPLTATSANKTGQPPARNGAQVQAAFGGELAAIVAGEAPGQLASTVVDASCEPLRVIRQGAIEI
jgi:tRNA threonylcarbamoyl adenosine modification protein (Sua5/YciO/YrdC/YwlC family)